MGIESSPIREVPLRERRALSLPPLLLSYFRESWDGRACQHSPRWRRDTGQTRRLQKSRIRRPSELFSANTLARLFELGFRHKAPVRPRWVVGGKPGRFSVAVSCLPIRGWLDWLMSDT